MARFSPRAHAGTSARANRMTLRDPGAPLKENPDEPLVKILAYTLAVHMERTNGAYIFSSIHYITLLIVLKSLYGYLVVMCLGCSSSVGSMSALYASSPEIDPCHFPLCRIYSFLLLICQVMVRKWVLTTKLHAGNWLDMTSLTGRSQNLVLKS